MTELAHALPTLESIAPVLDSYSLHDSLDPAIPARPVLKPKNIFALPTQEYQFYSKYSKWREEDQRRESWPEAVNRVISFFQDEIGITNLTSDEWFELHQSLTYLEATPAMRVLQMAGPALKRCHVGAYNCSYNVTDSLFSFVELLYILMQGTGAGFSVEQENIDKLPVIKYQLPNADISQYVIQDSTEGWCDAFHAGLLAWFDGRDFAFDYSQIRPEGTRLKTKGGRASGPGPLKQMLEFTRDLIIARQGGKLRCLDAHDINCMIAQIVQVGGVRRAATISLFDRGDVDMLHAKDWPGVQNNKQRYMSNNSEVHEDKPTWETFQEMWQILARSGTGEPGIFNRYAAYLSMPERRKRRGKIGINPCLTADSWIMTKCGSRQISELIGKQFTAIVDGKEYPSTSKGFFATGNKPVFRVETDSGFAVDATADHRILTARITQKVRHTEWKEVKDLLPGDLIVLNNQRGVQWEGRGVHDEGWLLGSLVGDGNIEKTGKANLDYWGDTRHDLVNHAVEMIHKYVGARADLSGCNSEKQSRSRIGSTQLGKLAVQYGISADKNLSEAILHSSSAFQCGFLQGWFDADGSVQGTQNKGVSVRLTSINLNSLKTAQRMLANQGIISKIYCNRRAAMLCPLPDGRGGQKDYACAAVHELIISKDNVQVYADIIGFREPNKTSKIQKLLQNYTRSLNRERFVAKVTSTVSLGIKDVYDCTIPGVHAFDANGMYVHNCAEILLWMAQFCNLSIVVARAWDTIETLKRKVRIATIFGTLQSCLTRFSYIRPEWAENCNEERLLGVDITGQMDCSLLRPTNPGRPELLDELLKVVIATNIEFADRLGIPHSAATTCVKPGGNSAQFFGCPSGIHGWPFPYMIRRFRAGRTDPLSLMLMAQGVPWQPVVGPGETAETSSVICFEFPVKAPEGAFTTAHMDEIETLENWLTWKTHWAEHSVSQTIYVSEDKWDVVGQWVFDHWDQVTGLSFFPKSDHKYDLAPQEEITEAEYTELMSRFPDINYSELKHWEKEDNTTGTRELSCVADRCEIL